MSELSYITLRGIASSITDRLQMFEKACEILSINVVEMKQRHNVVKGKVSLVQLCELCVKEKQTFQYHPETDQVIMICENVPSVGAKIIEDPTIIKETIVDSVDVPAGDDELNSLDSESEDDPF